MASTRIVNRVEISEFKELIQKYEGHIIVGSHALARIDEGQRNIYKEESLIDILKNETSSFIGIQENGWHSSFYKRKEGYLRIVFKINHPKNIEIITFYIVENLPKI